MDVFVGMALGWLMVGGLIAVAVLTEHFLIGGRFPRKADCRRSCWWVRSAIAEVYPALWSRSFARQDRTGDQHDAYSIAAWMRGADFDGSLAGFLNPCLRKCLPHADAMTAFPWAVPVNKAVGYKPKGILPAEW